MIFDDTNYTWERERIFFCSSSMIFEYSWFWFACINCKLVLIIFFLIYNHLFTLLFSFYLMMMIKNASMHQTINQKTFSDIYGWMDGWMNDVIEEIIYSPGFLNDYYYYHHHHHQWLNRLTGENGKREKVKKKLINTSHTHTSQPLNQFLFHKVMIFIIFTNYLTFFFQQQQQQKKWENCNWKKNCNWNITKITKNRFVLLCCWLNIFFYFG